MSRLFYSLVILFMIPTAAFAWSSKTEGPDVFGNTSVFASSGGGRDKMVIQCDTKDEFYIAYIFRKEEFSDLRTMSATFLIQVDKGAPVSFDAELRDWNDNYGGIVISDKSAEALQVIRDIGKAKSKINIGYELSGDQESASFSARGSTKAMKKILKGCKLNEENT